MSMPPRALVVEDDGNVVEFIRRTMVVLGHDCICATNVQDARKAMQQGTFDYALLDLKIPAMPDGLFPSIDCGMTFLAEIGRRRGDGRMRVIVMTSHTDQGFGMAVKLAHMGASRCVPKPLDDKPLSQIIQEVIADGNGHAAPAGQTGAAPRGGRRSKPRRTTEVAVPPTECYGEIDVRSSDEGFLRLLFIRNAGGRPPAVCQPIPVEGQLLAILVAARDTAVRKLREAEDSLPAGGVPEDCRAILEWTQDSLQEHVKGSPAAGRQVINRLRRLVEFRPGGGLVTRQDASGTWRSAIPFRLRASGRP